MMPQAVTDPVAKILRKAPAPDTVRADAWDAFESARDEDDLAERLQSLKIPDSVKADLWDLKASTVRPNFSTTNAIDEAGQPVVADRAPGLATIGDQLQAKRNPLVDVAIGAAKGVGNTVFGLGKVVRDYTPIGYISDAIFPGAFDQRPPEIVPDNTAQRIGYTAEQVGEFFVPGGAATKLAQVPKAAGLTLAQTGSPVEAGVSGAITAAIPGAATVHRVSRALREGAEKSMAQALGATKEWAKSDAAKLAPEMLARGVKGSRTTMLEQAKAKAKAAGEGIDAAIRDASAQGTTIPSLVARGNIQFAKDALMVKGANGAMIPIEGAQRAAQKLDKLDAFVEKLGPDIPIAEAQRIKQAWDKIVSKAGLYGPKSTSSATDNADAWAIREASTSFRQLLADASPDLAKMNREFAFWGGLRNVLKETAKRTQAQGGGLVAGVTGAAGVASGLASGNSLGDKLQNAFMGGLAGRQLVKLLQSPTFRTSVAGPMKDALADALAAGSTPRVLHVMSKIGASLPAQVRQ